MYKSILIIFLAVLLSACGGGGGGLEPSVNQIQAQRLRYGQTASILVAGQFMRSSMTADTGSCTNPAFASTSTPDLATLTCTVTNVGALPINIRNAEGGLLYATTLRVLPPQVTLVTSAGNIVMELNPAVVPATVSNFLSYVNSGFYRSTLFHRVIAGFVAQGGGYTTGPVKKTGQSAAITLESNKGLLNTRSTVAMARTTDPNSATSEFFINLANNPSLDYQNANSPGYAVFGTVVQGMDVVDAIAATPTSTVNSMANVPNTDITITLAVQTQ